MDFRINPEGLFGIAFIFVSLCCFAALFIMAIMIKNNKNKKLNKLNFNKYDIKSTTKLRKRLSEALIAAGYTGKASIRNFFIIQLLLIAVIPAIIYYAGRSTGIAEDKVIITVCTGLAAALILPSLQLYSKKLERQDKILKSLPNVLDILVVSIAAGLGFDAALMKTADKLKGPLADELAFALKQIQMGKTRKAALQEMANRTGVETLISFISAINQADQLGVSLANVLRMQSEAIRSYLRQRVDEQIAKISVKMLFPLIFLMFPSIFVVLLGPSIIQLIKYLFG